MTFKVAQHELPELYSSTSPCSIQGENQTSPRADSVNESRLRRADPGSWSDLLPESSQCPVGHGASNQASEQHEFYESDATSSNPTASINSQESSSLMDIEPLDENHGMRISDDEMSPEHLILMMKNATDSGRNRRLLFDDLLPWLISSASKDEMDGFFRQLKDQISFRYGDSLTGEKPTGIRKNRGKAGISGNRCRKSVKHDTKQN